MKKKLLKTLILLMCIALIVPFATACQQTCTIEFKVGAGSLIEPVTVNKGEIIEEEPISARPGYTFGGWYDGDTKITFPYAVTESKEFTAKWVATEYSIEFNLNGGIGAQDRSYIISDLPLSLPNATVMQKTGYTFGGWYSNAQLTGAAVTSVIAATMGDKVFYARWNPVAYSITYHLDGGQHPAEYPSSYTIETAAELKAPSKGEQASFGGWFDNADLNGNAVTSIPAGSMGNKEFWAKWEAVDFSITYHLNSGSHPSVYPQGYSSFEEVELKDPSRLGYQFDGWFDNEELSGTAK